ncbi:MAG: hypothetical protein RL094_506 [Candidatus Parcubacteria bacterium]|jgi:tryptophanyl-tRNA synthetase
MKKTILSGVKPSGQAHLGNYFGAMKQFVDLQDHYTGYFMIADLHALNTVQDAKEMAENTLNLAIDYLAIGLDPQKSVIFKQSDVPAHTELTWILNTIVTMPYLSRAHAFKDAEAKNKEVNVGTFDYPILMAADILLYDTDLVPVGKDQKQHVEIARDIAEKFNRIYGQNGDTFKLPQELIKEETQTTPGIDGQKMSKSYKNYIPLFAEDDEIQKLVMSIVTDSSGGLPVNVYAIHQLFRSEDELKKIYAEHEGKYKVLKELLAEDIKAFIRPLRERRKAIAADKKAVLRILKEGGERARAQADMRLAVAKKNVGLTIEE